MILGNLIGTYVDNCQHAIFVSSSMLMHCFQCRPIYVLSSYDRYARLINLTLQSWVSEGFFPGGDNRELFQIFSRGVKSGEICFFPLKTKKTTFFILIKFSKYREGKAPPCPPPTPMTSCLSCPHAYIVTWFLLCRADI